ncbi:hypothetical protein Tco_0285325 [Tanacetum coccineum]
MMVMVVVMTHLIPLHIRLASVIEVWEAEKPPWEARRWQGCKDQVEWRDQGTMLQVDPNVAWSSNFVGELVREFPMHYPS